MGFPTLKTRNGTTAIIYSRQGGGKFPIHGAYYAGNNEWIPYAWTEEGRVITVRNSPLDIDIGLRDLDKDSNQTGNS